MQNKQLLFNSDEVTGKTTDHDSIIFDPVTFKVMINLNKVPSLKAKITDTRQEAAYVAIRKTIMLLSNPNAKINELLRQCDNQLSELGKNYPDFFKKISTSNGKLQIYIKHQHYIKKILSEELDNSLKAIIAQNLDKLRPPKYEKTIYDEIIIYNISLLENPKYDTSKIFAKIEKGLLKLAKDYPDFFKKISRNNSTIMHKQISQEKKDYLKAIIQKLNSIINHNKLKETIDLLSNPQNNRDTILSDIKKQCRAIAKANREYFRDISNPDGALRDYINPLKDKDSLLAIIDRVRGVFPLIKVDKDAYEKIKETIRLLAEHKNDTNQFLQTFETFRDQLSEISNDNLHNVFNYVNNCCYMTKIFSKEIRILLHSEIEQVRLYNKIKDTIRLLGEDQDDKNHFLKTLETFRKECDNLATINLDCLMTIYQSGFNSKRNLCSYIQKTFTDKSNEPVKKILIETIREVINNSLFKKTPPLTETTIQNESFAHLSVEETIKSSSWVKNIMPSPRKRDLKASSKEVGCHAFSRAY